MNRIRVPSRYKALSRNGLQYIEVSSIFFINGVRHFRFRGNAYPLRKDELLPYNENENYRKAIVCGRREVSTYLTLPDFVLCEGKCWYVMVIEEEGEKYAYMFPEFPTEEVGMMKGKIINNAVFVGSKKYILYEQV